MKYFLAHNEIDVFHYNQLQDNQTVTTGQPFLEYFTTEQELIDRILELNQEYISSAIIVNQSGL